MRKFAIATVTAGFVVGGVALPMAASASAHSQVKHHKHNTVKNAPCGGKVLGIDLALGSTNICIPL
ncbi:MAG TPA: hypothetical protein VHV76_15920 [Mycobacteriales bacterium]|nr:hypothetical protein [Mycobacteriales bacterium]